jgi:hypothetical protein
MISLEIGCLQCSFFHIFEESRAIMRTNFLVRDPAVISDLYVTHREGWHPLLLPLPESGIGVLPYGFTQKNGQANPYQDITGKNQYGAFRAIFSQRL